MAAIAAAQVSSKGARGAFEPRAVHLLVVALKDEPCGDDRGNESEGREAELKEVGEGLGVIALEEELHLIGLRLQGGRAGGWRRMLRRRCDRKGRPMRMEGEHGASQ